MQEHSNPLENAKGGPAASSSVNSSSSVPRPRNVASVYNEKVGKEFTCVLEHIDDEELQSRSQFLGMHPVTNELYVVNQIVCSPPAATSASNNSSGVMNLSKASADGMPKHRVPTPPRDPPPSAGSPDASRNSNATATSSTDNEEPNKPSFSSSSDKSPSVGDAADGKDVFTPSRLSSAKGSPKNINNTSALSSIVAARKQEQLFQQELERVKAFIDRCPKPVTAFHLMDPVRPHQGVRKWCVVEPAVGVVSHLGVLGGAEENGKHPERLTEFNRQLARRHLVFKVRASFVRDWLAQVIDHVDAMHSKGLTCWNLKPRNILIDNHGKIRIIHTLHRDIIHPTVAADNGNEQQQQQQQQQRRGSSSSSMGGAGAGGGAAGTGTSSSSSNMMGSQPTSGASSLAPTEEELLQQWGGDGKKIDILCIGILCVQLLRGNTLPEAPMFRSGQMSLLQWLRLSADDPEIKRQLDAMQAARMRWKKDRAEKIEAGWAVADDSFDDEDDGLLCDEKKKHKEGSDDQKDKSNKGISSSSAMGPAADSVNDVLGQGDLLMTEKERTILVENEKKQRGQKKQHDHENAQWGLDQQQKPAAPMRLFHQEIEAVLAAWSAFNARVRFNANAKRQALLDCFCNFVYKSVNTHVCNIGTLSELRRALPPELTLRSFDGKRARNRTGARGSTNVHMVFGLDRSKIQSLGNSEKEGVREGDIAAERMGWRDICNDQMSQRMGVTAMAEMSMASVRINPNAKRQEVEKIAEQSVRFFAGGNNLPSGAAAAAAAAAAASSPASGNDPLLPANVSRDDTMLLAQLGLQIQSKMQSMEKEQKHDAALAAEEEEKGKKKNQQEAEEAKQLRKEHDEEEEEEEGARDDDDASSENNSWNESDIDYGEEEEDPFAAMRAAVQNIEDAGHKKKDGGDDGDSCSSSAAGGGFGGSSGQRSCQSSEPGFDREITHSVPPPGFGGRRGSVGMGMQRATTVDAVFALAGDYVSPSAQELLSSNSMGDPFANVEGTSGGASGGGGNNNSSSNAVCEGADATKRGEFEATATSPPMFTVTEASGDLTGRGSSSSAAAAAGAAAADGAPTSGTSPACSEAAAPTAAGGGGRGGLRRDKDSVVRNGVAHIDAMRRALANVTGAAVDVVAEAPIGRRKKNTGSGSNAVSGAYEGGDGDGDHLSKSFLGGGGAGGMGAAQATAAGEGGVSLADASSAGQAASRDFQREKDQRLQDQVAKLEVLQTEEEKALQDQQAEDDNAFGLGRATRPRLDENLAAMVAAAAQVEKEEALDAACAAADSGTSAATATATAAAAAEMQKENDSSGGSNPMMMHATSVSFENFNSETQAAIAKRDEDDKNRRADQNHTMTAPQLFQLYNQSAIFSAAANSHPTGAVAAAAGVAAADGGFAPTFSPNPLGGSSAGVAPAAGAFAPAFSPNPLFNQSGSDFGGDQQQQQQQQQQQNALFNQSFNNAPAASGGNDKSNSNTNLSVPVLFAGGGGDSNDSIKAAALAVAAAADANTRKTKKFSDAAWNAVRAKKGMPKVLAQCKIDEEDAADATDRGWIVPSPPHFATRGPHVGNSQKGSQVMLCLDLQTRQQLAIKFIYTCIENGQVHMDLKDRRRTVKFRMEAEHPIRVEHKWDRIMSRRRHQITKQREGEQLDQMLDQHEQEEENMLLLARTIGAYFKNIGSEQELVIYMEMLHGGGLGDMRKRFVFSELQIRKMARELLLALMLLHEPEELLCEEEERRLFGFEDGYDSVSAAEAASAVGSAAGSSAAGTGGSRVNASRRPRARKVVTKKNSSSSADGKNGIATTKRTATHSVFVHHDIKIDNIILCPDGRARFIDFGESREFECERDDEGYWEWRVRRDERSYVDMIERDMTHLSPEYARSKIISPKGDIWSFGLVVLYLFAGTQPFSSKSRGCDKMTDCGGFNPLYHPFCHCSPSALYDAKRDMLLSEIEEQEQRDALEDTATFTGPSNQGGSDSMVQSNNNSGSGHQQQQPQQQGEEAAAIDEEGGGGGMGMQTTSSHVGFGAPDCGDDDEDDGDGGGGFFGSAAGDSGAHPAKERDYMHVSLAETTEECKDFIRQCLTVNRRRRPTAKQLLQHKWFSLDLEKNDPVLVPSLAGSRMLSPQDTTILTREASTASAAATATAAAQDPHHHRLLHNLAAFFPGSQDELAGMLQQTSSSGGSNIFSPQSTAGATVTPQQMQGQQQQDSMRATPSISGVSFVSSAVGSQQSQQSRRRCCYPQQQQRVLAATHLAFDKQNSFGSTTSDDGEKK